MKHLPVVVAFILAAGLIFAGTSWSHTPTSTDNLWQDVEESTLSRRSQDRWVVPAKYRLVAANVAALDDILNQAPLAPSAAARDSNVVLTLPLPDGSYGRFRIQEAPIMEPELAHKLPQVKTYRGFGLDDATATARFDRTSAGFHGIIFSASDTVYIDPYQRGDVSNYVSYYKHDYGNYWDKTFEEGVVESLSQDIPLQLRTAASAGPILRTYRLAVAATGEYTQFHGGTVAAAQAAIVTTMNRVTGIYERELSVSFTLVDNTSIVFTDPDTDPYTNTSADLAANQSTIDANIGSANYDIGHLVGTGGGGIASLGIVCSNLFKARGLTGSSNPVGDPFDVDFVAHEMGHQFGGRHTFNADQTGSCGGGNRSATTAYEPGSGSTIQAYAGICGTQDLQSNSDDYFHGISFDQIMDHVTIGSGKNCGTQTATGNSTPTVEAGADYVIPANTPFTLNGSATDTDGNDLTFAWEEFDLGPPPVDESVLPNTDADGNARPIFRSFKPVTATYRIFPTLSNIVDGSYANIGESLPTIDRTMHFRLTARDNLGGVNYDAMTVTVASTSGPFRVITPSGSLIWAPATQHTVQWNVANTTASPVSCPNVNILLSTDGGQTFSHTLAANTPNDGSHTITVPDDVSTTSALVKVECANNIFFDISNQGLAVCTPLLDDDHEAVTTHWTESYSTTLTENHWQLKIDGGGYSGSDNYWYVQDIASTSVSFLESETLTATHTDADGMLFLRFYHQYNLENDYDGGVLEINVNGSGWTYVENNQFTQNGYNTTIGDDAFGSPLRNKDAFSRNSDGYIESQVDLKSLVDPGQTFQIRFLQANDFTNGADGWYVDDVLICSNASPTVPVLGMDKTGPSTAGPGERITYTVIVSNSGAVSATNALVSDNLPDDVTYAGPIALDPPSAGTIGTPPTLASGLTITPGQRITITFPVTVNLSLAGGTAIANTAVITSAEVATPRQDQTSLTVLNVPPQAVDDTGNTDEHTPLALDVLTNDDDRNGDTLSITEVGLPNHGSAAISGTTEIVYTPTNRPLTYNAVFTYTASDGDQAATATVNITVTADDDPPTISDIDNQWTQPGVSRGPIPFTVHDPDTPPAALTLDRDSSDQTLVPLANITFGGAGVNRTITLTPTVGLTGTATITVTVNDGNAFAYDTFDLLVTTDNPPQFISTAVLSATVDTLYTYVITATDPDAGDVLTITAVTKPDWLAFTRTGSGTARLSGTPTITDVGQHPVALSVRDILGLTDSQTFSVTVSEAPWSYIYLPIVIRH